MFKEWTYELRAASERDWPYVMFKDRPYDTHIKACETCQQYELTIQEKYNGRTRGLQPSVRTKFGKYRTSLARRRAAPSIILTDVDSNNSYLSPVPAVEIGE